MSILPLVNAGALPAIGKFFPWTDPRKNNIRILPIGATVRAENTVLPYNLIHEYIDLSKFRVAMNSCGCREANACKNHRHDIGCIFMGESARDIPAGVSREISKEEAHSIVENAVADGLVPLTGKVRIDNFIFLTKDRSRLLSVCFCCECCCMMRSFRHLPASLLNEVIRPIEGVTINRDAALCAGCGECAKKCPFKAVRVRNGKAQTTDACRKCGRCERVCANGAVTVSIDGRASIESLRASIDSFVSIG